MQIQPFWLCLYSMCYMQRQWQSNFFASIYYKSNESLLISLAFASNYSHHSSWLSSLSFLQRIVVNESILLHAITTVCSLIAYSNVHGNAPDRRTRDAICYACGHSIVKLNHLLTFLLFIPLVRKCSCNCNVVICSISFYPINPQEANKN